jgi:hypothetical protein
LQSFETLALTASAIIPDPPANLAELITLAAFDIYNPPLTEEEAVNFSNCTFVDDKCIRAVHGAMRDALHQSLISAFLLFGFPGEDRGGACLQDEKWDPEISRWYIKVRSEPSSMILLKISKIIERIKSIFLGSIDSCWAKYEYTEYCKNQKLCVVLQQYYPVNETNCCKDPGIEHRLAL